MSDTRTSPIAKLVADAPAEVRAVLNHPTEMVKLGVKGRELVEWVARHDIALPAQMYDTLPVGEAGVLARVGAGELILECAADDPLLARFNAGLETAGEDAYRVEQQSVTLVLRGNAALGVLAQTCGVDFAGEPVGRMVYTRVAGASCGVLPLDEDGQRVYRLWIDYSLAPYMWETLAEIAAELTTSARTSG
jgi:sarcosine oxidase gamma subunit